MYNYWTILLWTSLKRCQRPDLPRGWRTSYSWQMRPRSQLPAWSVVIVLHFWQSPNNQSSIGHFLNFFCLHVYVTGSGHQTQKNAHPLPKTRSSPAESNDQLQPDFHGCQVGVSGDGLRINCRHPLDRFLASYLDKIEPGTNNYYNGIFGRPSFPQFVDVMLKKPGEGWDEHWAPISSLCPPCLRWAGLSTDNHQIIAVNSESSDYCSQQTIIK